MLCADDGRAVAITARLTRPTKLSARQACRRTLVSLKARTHPIPSRVPTAKEGPEAGRAPPVFTGASMSHPDRPTRAGPAEPPRTGMRPRPEDSPPLQPLSEAAGGSEGGRLGELYRRHGDEAVRLAYLLTGDKMLAEDVVQDAFVKLAGRLVHLRDPGAFHAYLRRTIVNLTNSHYRRKRLERAYIRRERGTAAAISPGVDVSARDEIWEALGKLSERQRAAIVLRYYEDLSEQKVAEILRCRPGTVKSLVSRGL